MHDDILGDTPATLTKRCAAPGCKVRLQAGTITRDRGFCGKHLSARIAPAFGKRVQLVPQSNGTNGFLLSMPVSLPREPWVVA